MFGGLGLLAGKRDALLSKAGQLSAELDDHFLLVCSKGRVPICLLPPFIVNRPCRLTWTQREGRTVVSCCLKRHSEQAIHFSSHRDFDRASGGNHLLRPPSGQKRQPEFVDGQSRPLIGDDKMDIRHRCLGTSIDNPERHHLPRPPCQHDKQDRERDRAEHGNPGLAPAPRFCGRVRVHGTLRIG